LVPALRASSPNLNEFMKEGRSTTAGASHNRLRGILVVAETTHWVLRCWLSPGFCCAAFTGFFLSILE
jgi:hypothetical protein